MTKGRTQAQQDMHKDYNNLGLKGVMEQIIRQSRKDTASELGIKKSKYITNLLDILSDDKKFEELADSMDEKNPRESIKKVMAKGIDPKDLVKDKARPDGKKPSIEEFTDMAAGALEEYLKKVREQTKLINEKQANIDKSNQSLKNTKLAKRVLAGVAICFAILVAIGITAVLASTLSFAIAGPVMAVGIIGTKAAVIGGGCALAAGLAISATAGIGSGFTLAQQKNIQSKVAKLTNEINGIKTGKAEAIKNARESVLDISGTMLENAMKAKKDKAFIVM